MQGSVYNDEYECLNRRTTAYKWLNCVIALNFYLAQCREGGVKNEQLMAKYKIWVMAFTR
jgi:hypothetical protein